MRYLLLFFLLLHGCAIANRPLAPTLLAPATDSPAQFYTVTIKDGIKVRFSGLLGISANDQGLHSILLDATGITLLETQIDSQGNVSQKRVLGPLKKTQLPGFLAGALKRIFLEQPTPRPCEQRPFATFCEERLSAESGKKWLQTGPVTWWSVQYSDTDPDNRGQSLVYSQFLSNITLHLRKNSQQAMITP